MPTLNTLKGLRCLIKPLLLSKQSSKCATSKHNLSKFVKDKY